MFVVEITTKFWWARDRILQLNLEIRGCWSSGLYGAFGHLINVIMTMLATSVY